MHTINGDMKILRKNQIEMAEKKCDRNKECLDGLMSGLADWNGERQNVWAWRYFNRYSKNWKAKGTKIDKTWKEYPSNCGTNTKVFSKLMLDTKPCGFVSPI